MSEKIMEAGFDHPCRDKCSGWKQGFERGQLEFRKNVIVHGFTCDQVAMLAKFYEMHTGKDPHQGIDLREGTQATLLLRERDSLMKQLKDTAEVKNREGKPTAIFSAGFFAMSVVHLVDPNGHPFQAQALSFVPRIPIPQNWVGAELHGAFRAAPGVAIPASNEQPQNKQ